MVSKICSLVHGQAHSNGDLPMTLHNYKQCHFHRISNRKNSNAPNSSRDMYSSCWISPYRWNGQPCASPYRSNGQMTMMLEKSKLRQFHRTSNRENPSSGFRYSGPKARPYGSNGQVSITLHNYRSRRSREFQRTSNEGNLSIDFGGMHSAKSGPAGDTFYGLLVFSHGANEQMIMVKLQN